jgi:hypothetical protein
MHTDPNLYRKGAVCIAVDEKKSYKHRVFSMLKIRGWEGRSLLIEKLQNSEMAKVFGE